MSIPYRHCDSTGVPRLGREELFELSREAHRAGVTVGVHAIGDVAIELTLEVFERLYAESPGPAHRIEHFGLPSAEQLARAARLGVVAVPQTIFIHSLGPNFRAYLPDALLPRAYPVRAMLDAGVPVALSSDAPVVKDDDPLAGILAAVTRRDSEGERIAPEQAISVAEALRGYTAGGALAAGDQDRLGTLSPGKLADLAVLSGDPLGVEPDAIGSLRVEETYVGGARVYSRT